MQTWDNVFRRTEVFKRMKTKALHFTRILSESQLSRYFTTSTQIQITKLSIEFHESLESLAHQDGFLARELPVHQGGVRHEAPQDG